MKVFIDLQEGFENDEVSIFDKQKKIFKAENVKTRTQIGLATSLEVELSGEKANLRIAIPSRNINEKKEITLTDNLHIAVSVTEENKLDWKLSDSPFFYM